jgi:hypothetical protein
MTAHKLKLYTFKSLDPDVLVTYTLMGCPVISIVVIYLKYIEIKPTKTLCYFDIF